MVESISKTIVNFTEARSHLSELVNQVAREETRVVIEKHGVPVGVIVSPRDFRRLEMQAAIDKRQMEAITRIGQAFTDVSDEEIEQELRKAQAEVREEMRAERDTKTVS
jgi:prevent-host-death family protein